jgi:Zn ribbon nucleic-acid-binding protein
VEKYQRTRSIRFKLLPCGEKQIENEINAIKACDNSELKNNCIGLVAKGRELGEELKTLIVANEDKNGNLKLKKDVEIKYTWLRLYTKTEFYDFRNSNTENKKIFSLKEIDFLKDKIKNWLQTWDGNLNLLNDYIIKTTEEQHNLNRKSEIGKIVQSLSKRDSFLFIKDFISFAKFKNASDEKIKDLIKEVDVLLRLCEKGFLPTQSAGYPIARASFNYYTIFKNPKNFDEDIKNIQTQGIPENIDELVKSLEDDSVNLNKFYNIQKIIKTSKYNALSQLSTSMKLFKARAKSKFLESIQKNPNLSFEELQNYPLFSNFRIDNKSDKGKSQKNIFNDFMELNKRLQLAADKINGLKKTDKEFRAAIEEKDDIAKARGKYFTALNSNKTYFIGYVKFCDIYKIAAQRFGHLNARIKGIEKEKIESQRLLYWSAVIEQDSKQYIALIPKSGDNAKKAYEYYSRLNKKGSCKLFYFESLTHRALEKLCFTAIQEGVNKFYYGIQKELSRQKYPQYYNKKGYFIDGEYCFNNNGQKNESEVVQFYKDILNTNYVRIVLKGVRWDNLKDTVLDKSFTSFDDFKQALEKYSYVKVVKSDDNLLKELSEIYNAEIFEITSLDLNKKCKKNIKEHTDLWLKFWDETNETDNYSIRINPQITVFWRNSKFSREEKYGVDSKLFDDTKENRYLYPQYTLTTTITENAAAQNMNFAFKSAQSKKEQIANFNTQLFTAFNPEYYYGIDTGEKELATLSLTKKDNSNVSPQLFEVYTLKDLNYAKEGYIYNDKKEPVQREKLYRAIENLSYFLNKDMYDKKFQDGKFQETFNSIFEKKNVSAIDLTTAKVINGKIITNGDIITFLNLKILNARRKIYQELTENPKSVLEERDFKLYYENKKVYISRKDFDCIKPYEQIKKELFDYHSNTKKNLIQLEENINKTRKSLVGNMIGVISYLYKTHNGVIVMENLKQNTVESHRKSFEGDLARPLEFALYNKYIKENLVPPMLGEIIQLREQNNNLNEVGIINFIDEKWTSTTCPKCNEKSYKSASDEKYLEDKKEKIFNCIKCGFHNKNNPMGFESLDDNDKVASFNIAKRGFENFQNKKTSKK